jgi:Ca-activated chloride channel family protein
MLSNLGSNLGRAGLTGMACVLVLVGVLVVPPSPASAADEAPGKLMLVLDSSGSMKEKVPGGQTKIAAAKDALHRVVKQLPADQPVGLRVFGAKVFSRNDKGACQDSQLRVPVGTGNQAALDAEIDSYKPYGETPIGYALQQAAKDLGSEGQRSIVLVSDGEPTCEPSPCEVAKELTKQGIDLKIDVVGLDVDAKTGETLRCIAENGHGTYYDVDNADDFASSLIKVTTRAARGFSVVGEPVTATPTEDGAPTITNGDWQDVTPATAGEKVLTYKVERQLTNSWLAVSTAFRDPADTVMTSLELTASDGSSCGVSGEVEQLAGYQLTSAGVQATPFDTFGDEKPDSPCITSPYLVATLVLDKDATPGTPIEVRVMETPEVTNLTELPAPFDQEPVWKDPAAGKPTPAQGGTSFMDAPALEPGSYTDSIVQGETLTYQVKLDWGQQLSAQVTLPGLDKNHRDAAGGTPLANLRIYNPARGEVTSDELGSGHNSQMAYFGDPHSVLSTVAGPVRVRNAAASSDSVAGADLAGNYTVVVFLSKDTGRSIPIPFQLDLGVTGTVEGAPTYAEELPPTASADASEEPGDDPASEPTNTASGETKKDDGGFPVAGLLGGLGVLAIAGAAAVFLRSRKA